MTTEAPAFQARHGVQYQSQGEGTKHNQTGTMVTAEKALICGRQCTLREGCIGFNWKGNGNVCEHINQTGTVLKGQDGFQFYLQLP